MEENSIIKGSHSARILAPESIGYIHEKTKDICKELGLETEKYLGT